MAMTGAPNSGRQLSKLSVGYPVPPWLLKAQSSSSWTRWYGNGLSLDRDSDDRGEPLMRVLSAVDQDVSR